MLPKRISLPTSDSVSSLHNNDGTKKRVSMSASLEDPNLRTSGVHSTQVNSFESTVAYEECCGIDDVVITPTYMEFKDGSEGNTMEQNLILQNVGNRSAFIRIKHPNSMAFKIKTITKDGYRLCPGLSLTTVVNYEFKRPSSIHAMIPIEINGTELYYHLICTMSAPRIIVEPTILEFGYVDVLSLSDIKTLTVTNIGGISARFDIDMGKSEVVINVYPRKAIIKPNEQMTLSVQVTGKNEGSFRGEFWIVSQPNIRITIKMKIIKPNITLQHETITNGFSLLKFPATFLETRRYMNIFLKNNSSQVANFLVLNESLRYVKTLDTVENCESDAFAINPRQGRLKPFEKIILTITFFPTFKKLQVIQKQMQNKSINYFAAIMKIFKIQITEAKDILKIEHEKNDIDAEKHFPEIYINELLNEEKKDEEIMAQSDQPMQLEVTAYLYGNAEIAQIDFVPNEFHLGDLNIDDRIQRVIFIKNLSKCLSLTFSFFPMPCVQCKPRKVRLRPNQSVEVLIAINAQYNLESPFNLVFEIWAESANENELNKMKSVTIECHYNPLKAHGKIKENRMCKAVSFHNLPLEPNFALTYTVSEFEMKMDHREYWTQTCRKIFAPSNRNIAEDISPCSYELNNYFDSFVIPKIDNILIAQKHQQQFHKPIAQGSEKIRKLSKPLLPLELYKIQVSPLKVDFGKVSVKTTIKRYLTVENKNNFRVMVSLITLDSKHIIFPCGNIRVLEANSKVKCPIVFEALNFGKYHSYFNYIINNCQRFQLPITANVALKCLELKTKEVIFEKDCLPQEGYRIQFKFIEIENKLNVDTKFKWRLPDNTNIVIRPEQGTVPGNRKLYVGVFLELDPRKSNRIEATMRMECGTRASLKVESPIRAPNVILLNDIFDVGEVPLNIATRLQAVLYNAEYFDVFYEIDKQLLLKGLIIKPTRGVIPARGIVILNLQLKFDACIEFSTQINIVVQKRLTLTLRLSCSVVFPKLKFKPQKIEMKRISLNSYQFRKIQATNLTNCDATIQILLEEYPEFHVSYSEFISDSYIDNGKVINIAPMSTVTLYLHLIPCDIASYSFFLPIVINELLGSIEDNNVSPSQFLNETEDYYTEFTGISLLSLPEKLPSIIVECTVTHPKIIFNKLIFYFNDSVQQDEILISNNTENEVLFIFITESFKNASNCPFTICWHQGGEPRLTNNFLSCLLYANQQACFKIRFRPKQPGHFMFEVPINLETIDKRQMYNKLLLKGSYLTPCIESDVLEIYLVPIPLNVLVKETFTLQIHCFMKPTHILSKICHPEKCSGTFSDETLKILFPDGNSIDSFSRQEISVELQFTSSVPVSFCATVMFSDTEDLTSLSITVYGTADNSLLTTHIYEKTINQNFVLRKQQELPFELDLLHQADENESLNQIDELGQNISVSSHINRTSKQSELQEERMNSLDSRKSLNAHRTSLYNITTNSSSKLSSPSKSFYPFFPLYNEIDQEKMHMNRSLSAVEMWLYSTAVRYEFNLTINDGITATLSGVIPFEAASKGDKKKSYPKPCSFINVLENYLDSEEISEINILMNEDESENNRKRINDVLNTYQKILQLLLLKGACIAHISSEFLLSYNDYEVLNADSDLLVSEYAFKSRSMQSWHDLILQTYKCFVLNKINKKEIERHAALMNDATSIESFADSETFNLNVLDITNRSKKYTLRSKYEAILLAWLEYIYEKKFNTRPINDFEDCLSDGLVFIAVTITYCPFLKDEFFSNIYLNPVRSDQKLHNVICLLLAWKKIRLGFIVTPLEIINPNCIQMLMLTVHLFQTLPTYLIKNKVTLSCGLTKSITRQIKLSITCNYQINYVVQFFGNSMDSFSSKPIAPIYPNKNPQLKVTYHARKITKSKVYVMLCGSAIGFHFGENQTFVLEGFPDELEISNEYKIRSKLYQVVEKHLTITVPYDYQTEYEVWLTDEIPSNPDKLKMIRYTDFDAKRTPKRLLLNQSKLVMQEDSPNEANLWVTIACMSTESRSFLIIFRSEFADFIIKIISIHQSTITDFASIEMDDEKCICPDVSKQTVSHCPRNKKILITSANIHLHNCILRLFQKSVKAEEKPLWTTHLDNTIGLQLMMWLIRNVNNPTIKEFKRIFNTNITYNITTNKSKALLVPYSISITGNQDHDDKFELIVHVCEPEEEEEKEKLTEANITLISSDKQDLRICKVNFIYNKSETVSAEEISKRNNKYKANKETKKRT